MHTQQCNILVFIRGGGDLASGVALRLHRAGLSVVISELPQPLAVRRLVSFANAIFEGQMDIEEVQARRVTNLEETVETLSQGIIPVAIDPEARLLKAIRQKLSPKTSLVLIDGRMTKKPPDTDLNSAELVIGLGPGFDAGVNCHAIIETNRSHTLGRVIWSGEAQKDTGVPENVTQYGRKRVLRSPADGELQSFVHIGDHIEADEIIASVVDHPVRAPFKGVLRGMIYPGIRVWKGLKIGDVDPRDNPLHCQLISDKALSIGGGVLEAILSKPDLRPGWGTSTPWLQS